MNGMCAGGRVMHLAIGDHDGARDPAGGTSASAAFSAAKAWVPLFSPVVVVVTLASRTVRLGCARELAAHLPPAPSSAWAARSPTPMLCERSTTTATTSGSGAWVSFTRIGPASANSRMAKASPRAQAPRAPRQKLKAVIASASAASSRQQRQRNMRIEGQPGHFVPQPLQQGGRMHLVGLVIAGQGIHHQIDAEAIGHLALAFAARHRFGQRAGRSASTAQAAAQSLPPMITGETPSPPRAGAGSLPGSAGGSASTQTWPPSQRPGKSCRI